MSLPTDRDMRNALPVWDGVVLYFPDVWAEIAKVSVAGNKQHALGAKLHWDTSVSTDHANKVFRHMLDDATGSVMDEDGTFHLAKAMWRLGAMLQLRIWERDGKDQHGNPRPRAECDCIPERLRHEYRRVDGAQARCRWCASVPAPMPCRRHAGLSSDRTCTDCGWTVL